MKNNIEDSSNAIFDGEYIINTIKEHFTLEENEQFLSKLKFISKTEYEILFSTPTEFLKNIIMTRFLSGSRKKIDGINVWVQKGIKQIIQEKYPLVQTITIIVESSLNTQKHINNIHSTSQYDNLYNVGTDLNKFYTFENFVVGGGNKLAYSVSLAMADESELMSFSNSLFLYGNVGLGKTHLLQAMAWKFKDKYPKKQIIYISAEKFMYLFVSALQNNNINTFKERFRTIDILFIDDLQFIAGKEATQKEFFVTFNELIDSGKKVIMACDRAPNDLKDIEDKLKSRLSGGFVADIFTPDYSTRVDIVNSKCKLLNLELSDEVKNYVAESAVDCRDIEGALKKIALHKQFVSETVNEENLEKIVGKNSLANKAITFKNIIEQVSKYYNTSINDIKSSSRQANLILPRQITMHLAKKMTHLSLKQIGENLNGRTHVSVIYGCKEAEKVISECNQTSLDVERIINNIKNS